MRMRLAASRKATTATAPKHGYAYGGANPYYADDDPGWFWDPYFDAYTWMPWDGIFFSPFGWGFYSPGFAYAAPFYGGGFLRRRLP